MNKVIVALVLLLAGATVDSYAQGGVIENVSARRGPEVRVVNNGEMYYAGYYKDEPDTADSVSFVIRFYDRAVHEMGNTEIRLSKTAELTSYAFNGQSTLCIVTDAAKKSRKMLSIGIDGRIFNQKEETEIKANLLTAENAPAIYVAGMNEFIVVTPTKERKGYKIETVDQELNEHWSKKIESDKGTLDIVQMQVDADRVYFLQKEKQNQNAVYSVVCLDGGSGNIMFNTELRMGEDLAMPLFLNTRFGMAYTAGIYIKESSQKNEGIFYSRIDPSGKIEKLNYYPWEILKQQLGHNHATGIANGDNKILIEDIIPNETTGGITLVGEYFKKSAGANVSTISISDFALLRFNAQDMLTGIDKIEKTEKELAIKGPMANTDEMALGTWLYANHFFTYRNKLQMADKTFLVYQNDDNGVSKAYFISADSVNKDNITTMDIERDGTTAGKDKKSKKDKEAVVANKYMLNSASQMEVDAFKADQNTRGIVPLNDGRVLLYSYDHPKFTFNVSPAVVR